MVTRKYIRDYKLSESVTARGGIRTEAVYVGTYYAFEDATLAERAARLLLPGCCLAWLLFVGALLPRSGASKLMWVILPYAFSALPLGYMTDSALLLYRRRGKRLIRSESEKLSKRLPVCAFWALALAGVSALALGVTALVSPGSVNGYDVIFGLCAALIAALGGYGFAVRERLRTAECGEED